LASPLDDSGHVQRRGVERGNVRDDRASRPSSRCRASWAHTSTMLTNGTGDRAARSSNTMWGVLALIAAKSTPAPASRRSEATDDPDARHWWSRSTLVVATRRVVHPRRLQRVGIERLVGRRFICGLCAAVPRERRPLIKVKSADRERETGAFATCTSCPAFQGRSVSATSALTSASAISRERALDACRQPPKLIRQAPLGRHHRTSLQSVQRIAQRRAARRPVR
jgi:hypothetical protein